MITIRHSDERGYADRQWLKSYHTFSFADYYDPQYMGVSALRVINEDWVAAGKGFATHPHDNMEIITYMIAGEIEHRDTMGNHLRLKAGEVQVMSAGTGIQHSEHNPSDTETLHLLQIWILPDTRNIEPVYAQKDFSHCHGFCTLVSPDGRDESLQIHQDALLHKLVLDGEGYELPVSSSRLYYIQVVQGEVQLNGAHLHHGDGAVIENESRLYFQSDTQSEVLLFDLP